MKQEIIDILLEYYGELMQERDSTYSHNWERRDAIIKKMNAIDLLLNSDNKQLTTMDAIWKTIKQPKKD
jgi:hypothetical protein